MDCQQALDLLESARPGSSDLHLPELKPAGKHLDGCPSCTETHRQRQAQDVLIAEAIQDVVVPSELEARLLASLEQKPAPEPVAGRPRVIGWRRIGRLAGMAIAGAVMILAIGSGLGWWDRSVTLTAEELRNLPELVLRDIDDPQAMRDLEEYTDMVAAAPPGWGRGWLRGKPRIVNVPEDGGPVGWIRPFRAGEIEGFLLVVSNEHVDSLPAAIDFLSAQPAYTKSDKFSATIWADPKRGVVYVCLVPPDQQDRLKQALQPRAA